MAFFEGQKTLVVEENDKAPGTVKPLLETDISDCSFCRGEEDNCAQDGIDIVEINAVPNPVIRMVCHVGAHSQRLMIFDPLKDRANPVLVRTGVYWLRTVTKASGFSIIYDKSGFGTSCPDSQPSSEGICEIQENWP